MRRTLWSAAACTFTILVGIQVGNCAEPSLAGPPDMSVPVQSARYAARAGNYLCQREWRCGPDGCGWQRVCWPRCPDGYSCYPLYGAYGPYGGVAYWGAYTSSGWVYRP